MTTQLQIRRQTVRVPGTTKVAISARADSDAPGQRLRAILVYTDDPAVPAFELQIEGADDAALAVPTPAGAF